MPKARSCICSSPTKPSQCKPSLSARRTEMLQPSEESCRARSSLPIISTGSPTAQKSRFARRPTQRAAPLFEHEETEETEKETSVHSVISCLALKPMHPLFEKASGL